MSGPGDPPAFTFLRLRSPCHPCQRITRGLLAPVAGCAGHLVAQPAAGPSRRLLTWLLLLVSALGAASAAPERRVQQPRYR